MANVIISADSTADLGEALVKKYAIRLFLFTWF